MKASRPAALAALVVSLLILSVSTGCSSGTPSEGGSTALAPDAPAASAPAPPAASVDRNVAILPVAVPVNVGASQALPLLGGDNRIAARAIASSLAELGLDSHAAQVHVFPIGGAKSGLLVLDYTAPPSWLMGSDAAVRRALGQIAGLEAVQTTNVSRLAVVFRGEDKSGPYVFTATTAMTTLEAAAAGTLAPADLQKQVQIQVKR